MELLHAIIRVVLIFLILFIERKKPGEALLWLVLVFIFPIIGGIIYLIFGSTIGIKITYRLRSKAVYKPYITLLQEQYKLLANEDSSGELSKKDAQIVHFNLMYADGALGYHNEADIITSGQEMYARLFEDIARATHHIHLAFYSIHNDRVGKELVDALVKKAEEGVEVKVLCDGFGGIGARVFLFQPLIKAGGKMKMIKPRFSHFRYHRKIVVIDGKVGYAGGMNIGCKYLGENPQKSPWRDTQVRIIGETVYMLQYYFLYDWLFSNSGKGVLEWLEKGEPLFPPLEGVTAELPCQVIASGVDTDKQTIKLSYIRMISSAQKKIVIQTPYFVPSLSVNEALKIALSSGVEVILQIPRQKANFFLDPVTRYFVAQLIPLGLKVFLYDGYVHSKTMRIDETITCIGSVNIDIRSLEIDAELCAIFYSADMARRYDQVLAKDFARSEELDYQGCLDRGLMKKAAERLFLLFSPLM